MAPKKSAEKVVSDQLTIDVNAYIRTRDSVRMIPIRAIPFIPRRLPLEISDLHAPHYWKIRHSIAGAHITATIAQYLPRLETTATTSVRTSLQSTPSASLDATAIV
jgi:hypothetical protein